MFSTTSKTVFRDWQQCFVCNTRTVVRTEIFERLQNIQFSDDSPSNILSHFKYPKNLRVKINKTSLKHVFCYFKQRWRLNSMPDSCPVSGTNFPTRRMPRHPPTGAFEGRPILRRLETFNFEVHLRAPGASVTGPKAPPDWG